MMGVFCSIFPSLISASFASLHVSLSCRPRPNYRFPVSLIASRLSFFCSNLLSPLIIIIMSFQASCLLSSPHLRSFLSLLLSFNCVSQVFDNFIDLSRNYYQLLHTLFSSIDTCVTMPSVHPASIAVKHALFSSIDTCVAMTSVHPASIAVKHALFSSNNMCQPLNQFIQLRLQ